MIIDALRRLIALLERRGDYVYEERNVKRWLAEPDSCEVCEDNEAMGWIPDEQVFDSEQFGFIDAPPAHFHCRCVLQYGLKRKRVYLR